MPSSFIRRNLGVALVASAFMASAAAMLFGGPAHAQLVAVPRQENSRSFGYVAAIGSYTNSTTSYTALTGATVTNSTVNDPGELSFQNASTYVPETLRVTWTADSVKATATTGTCGVYLNGVLVARSVRSQGFGVESTIGGYVELSKQNGDNMNTGSGTQTQTVALYCKSGDTNTVTVTGYSLNVQEVY